jgi:outer membrane protein W
LSTDPVDGTPLDSGSIDRQTEEKNMNSFLRTTTLIVAALVLLLGLPVQAQQSESITLSDGSQSAQNQKQRNWQFKISGVLLNADGGVTASASPGGVETSISAGGGVSLRLERRISSRYGVELGLSSVGADLDIGTGWGGWDFHSAVDLLTVTPFTVGFNFHLTEDSPVDFYVGPMVGQVVYSGLTIRVRSNSSHSNDHWWSRWTSEVDVSTDTDFTWGLNCGADFAFGRSGRWSGHIGLTYLDSDYQFKVEDEDHSTDVRMDPLMFNFGVGFRF